MFVSVFSTSHHLSPAKTGENGDITAHVGDEKDSKSNKNPKKQALNTSSSWRQDTDCVEILDRLSESASWMKDVGTLLLSHSQDVTCIAWITCIVC